MIKKRFLSIVLTLAMLLGMFPGMSLTVYAEGNTTITPSSTSGTMTITLTIKGAQTIMASDVTATYGDTDKSVSASVTTPTTDGGAISYTVKDGSGDYIDVASDGKLTIKKVPASGKAYVIVKAAATDDYAETTKEVTVTINKAEATVTAKDQSIMVGSTVPDLSAPVLNTHYSVTGLVGTDALTTAPTLAYQKNSSAATPDNTAAGTYDIVPSGASAGDNYNISYTNGTLTITAKDTQTITASDIVATYGDTNKSVSATTDGNGEISYAVKAGSEDYISVDSEGKLTIKKVPADGKAYVTVTASETNTGGTGDKGYAAATKEVTVNISKAAVTITAKDQSIYVGGTVPTLSGADFYTVSGLVGEDALTTNPTLAYQKNGSAATPDNTTAGTYDIVASGASAGDNYNISYTNGTLTISDKGTQTISAENVTVTYGETGKSVSATVTDPATGGGDISYAVKTGSADYIDVDASTGALTIKKVPADGKAYVTVTAAGTATYEQATKDVTVTINKANAVAATVTANSRTYDGTEKPLVTVTGEATGGEMQYALGTATEATGPYTTDIPTATDAGTYYVWYKVIGDDNHKNTEPGSVEVKINPVDKTDLNKAIEEAEAYYNSIKDNSDYSVQKEALGSAISKAKSLAENNNVTYTQVNEGIAAVNSAKTTAKTAVDDIIESNKEAFAAEKTTQKKNADSLAKDGDSDASRKLIEDAKKAIDAIDFDNTKTLDDNKAALADIITKLTEDLTTQRAADKLASDKAAFEVEKTTQQKAADALSEELDSDASKKLITDAKAAIEALTYDETKSLDVNKAAIEAVITSLKTDLGTQRAEDLATNKEAFGADKETQKKAADALAADGDSDASKRLIEDAKKAIDEPAYDETKSLDENKAALAAIVSKLKDELNAKRAEEKKEADDTAAAKKVIDAINALPAKEDVTSSDKEAVEAARAAYAALTASQKDKIDTATLQKLTDAEEALVALGELDKNVVAFNSEKNVQKAEAVKLAKEDDSDAVRKLIADAREAIDALAYDKNKSLDENKAVLAAIITELGNALEEQRELEKILAVVKIDQGETVAEVDKTAIKEEDVETVTSVAKSTAADLSEAATTCVKQIVEESETVEDSDKNIVIVPALDVKGKEYSVTETDATMTLDIEAVYTSYETTSDITTAADVKSATEAEDKTEKAKVKEIGSGKLDTEGTPVNVKIEVPAAFAGVLGATTETVKASPATIYVKHTHKNKNYEYNASLYCEGSKYFVEFVNPNGFSPFTLSGNSASVASIGDKNYTDLQSAIDDAADGSTIKLTNDNDVSATINTEKTITIDKDNHTGNVDIKAADTLLLTKTDNENGTTTYKTVTKYTVTFDNNGGKGTMPAQEIGGTAALNANAFTKEGYTFDGWNTTSDGSGTAYADKADVTPAADMTLYAQWKENPKPDDKDKTDAAVEAVKTKINALKAAEKITTADKAAVEAADKAYDALSEAQKKLIDAATLKKLTDAKEALKAAEKAESDKAAADAVKTKINALKAADKITTADKAAIEAARKAYDALSADQKKLVDAATLKKLTDAEEALKELTDKAAADSVTDTINKLPASDKVATTDKAAIEAARKAYDALTADQKAKVTPETLKNLEAAEKALAAAEKKETDDTDAAKKVTDAINALPASDKVATTDKATIEAARKAYDALTAEQKAKVTPDTLKKLEAAEKALATAEKKETDDTDAAKKVNDAIGKLPASDKVATTDKAAIEAARKAYDALTADQKKKVSADTLKKLTDAEAALKTATAKDKAAKELAAAKEEAQAAMNEQVTVTQKGSKFTVKWKKSSAADGYYVYAQYCGKKITKPAKTIAKNTTIKTTITKINGKKINQKRQFRVYVVPYKIIDGKKVALGKSTVAHLVGAKSTKYSNVKKLTLTKKKYNVKVGKTAKIKAKVTLVNKNKKHIPKGHGAKFRYKSSDTSIATVDKNGKIKGIKKGTCTIYVYSINGLMKKAKVTIK